MNGPIHRQNLEVVPIGSGAKALLGTIVATMSLSHIRVHATPSTTPCIISFPQLITHLTKHSYIEHWHGIIPYLTTTTTAAKLAALLEAGIEVDADKPLIQLHSI